MAPSIRIYRPKTGLAVLVVIALLLVVSVLVWQGMTAAGNPDPTVPGTTSWVAMFDIGVLVFREGLECILVLASVTAGLSGEQQEYRRPIAVGATVALVATLATWALIVSIINTLSERYMAHALDIQAATGLVAVIVLLIVMNWFLHKLYWTGWIRRHTTKKKDSW